MKLFTQNDPPPPRPQLKILDPPLAFVTGKTKYSYVLTLYQYYYYPYSPHYSLNISYVTSCENLIKNQDL